MKSVSLVILVTLALNGCANVPVEIDLAIGRQLRHPTIGENPIGTLRVRAYPFERKYREIELRGFVEFEHVSSLPDTRDPFATNNVSAGATLRFD